jgi:hypothetical protein
MPTLHRKWTITAAALAACMVLPGTVLAQDRDRDRDRWERDRDRDRDRVARVEPGTTISVRTNERIDVDRSDNRYYTGTVDQDVRGEDGRLAIPRGAQVQLTVRVARDNDLVLDLDSIDVHGERYHVRSDANRVESDKGVVGSILGAVTGGEVRGRAVRVPRDAVLSFRLERPLEIDR